MDPNAALDTLRRKFARLTELVDTDDFDQLDEHELAEAQDLASTLIDAFDGLDKWLSAGGFRPAAWNPSELSG
jgi:hypothetical protein